MKNDAPFSSKDLQLGHAVRRGLVRYIKRAHQRVKKQKPKMRNPAGLALTSKSGVADCSLAFAGTLVASVFFLITSSVAVVAVELVDPHAVLEQTRRDLKAFDKRMQRYKAERLKEEKELEARQMREEAERREREKAEMALAETRRKRDAAEQEKRVREEKEREARRKQEEANRQEREALQEAQRQRDLAEEQKRAIAATEQEARQKQEDAEREKAKEALQASQRERDAAAKATESQERGTASKQAKAEGEKTMEGSKPREGLRGMLSNREDRRSACRQQAEERGLSGRKASRYTRLCVSGLPIPKTLSR
jgi:DNA repair exonuclease SbcCD ATPase subunit